MRSDTGEWTRKEKPQGAGNADGSVAKDEGFQLKPNRKRSASEMGAAGSDEDAGEEDEQGSDLEEVDAANPWGETSERAESSDDEVTGPA